MSWLILCALGLGTGAYADDTEPPKYDHGQEAPPIPLTVPAAAELTVLDVGRGARRLLSWDPRPGDALEVQVVRQVDVRQELDGEVAEASEDLVVQGTLARGDDVTLTLGEVEGSGREVQILVELAEAGRFWAAHPWTIGDHVVDLGATDLELGADEVARQTLDALQLAWVVLPDVPVGRGARWQVRVAAAGVDPVVVTCTLAQRSRAAAVVDVTVVPEVPTELLQNVSITGRTWLRPGVPIPVGARFVLEMKLDGEGVLLEGRETITLTTR